MRRLPRLICVLVLLAGLAAGAPARAQVDTVRPFATDTGEFKMTKSPTEAVLLSTVLPGAGQVYLDQAWKVPIIWGIAGGFLAGALVQNGRYHTWADSAVKAEARGDRLNTIRYSNSREFYRDDRDKWWIYLGLTYIANILDAYIAAHLYDFDVSNPGTTTTPSHSVSPFYDPATHSAGLGVSVRF